MAMTTFDSVGLGSKQFYGNRVSSFVHPALSSYSPLNSAGTRQFHHITPAILQHTSTL